MLSFATDFPVRHTHTSTDFLHAIREWILGSPHTCLVPEDLAKLDSQGEWLLQKANERLGVLRVSFIGQDAAAVKYTKSHAGLEWVTTIAFSRLESDSWVSIRVSCESYHPAARLPPAKKPIVVRTLLNRLGGASDGWLQVGTTPRRLGNADIDVAARLISGRAGCRLPIVYVSSGFHGNHTVDTGRLATDLAGMAHVVVEPNRSFSLRLKIEVGSENAYGGNIGVYWPDGGGPRSFFISREFESARDIAGAVFEEIRTALTNRRALDRCTWAAIQEIASRRALEALKAVGSQEIDKYIEEFDKELRAKDQRLEHAEKEIARLHSELRVYETRLPASGVALGTGDEQDLYPNELVEIVRDALEDASRRIASDSRRQHVLGAMLRANASSGEARSMREKLKNLLRGSRGLDRKVRHGLEGLGFEISEAGKHYKLTFQGDDRYTFTLAKSGSDRRGGLNAASDIARLLF